MSAGLPGRVPIRVLFAIGEGIRLAIVRAPWFWPVAFVVEGAALAVAESWSLWFDPFDPRHPGGIGSWWRGLNGFVAAAVNYGPALFLATFLARAVARARQREPVELLASLRAGGRAVLVPLAVTGIVSTIAGGGTVVAAGVLDRVQPLQFLWTVGCVVALMFALARYGLAGPIAACEGLAPRAAIERAPRLIEGMGGRMFGFVVLVAFAWLLLQLTTNFFLLYEARMPIEVDSLEPVPFVARLPGLAGRVAAHATFWLFPATISAVLYDRVRSLKEGLTIDELERTFA